MPCWIPFRNPETARARIPHGSWLPPLKSTFSSAGSWASRQNRRSFPRRRVISLTFWRSLTQRPTRAGPFGSTRMSIWVGIGRRIKAKVGAFIEVLFISPPSQSTPLVTLKTAADNASKTPPCTDLPPRRLERKTAWYRRKGVCRNTICNMASTRRHFLQASGAASLGLGTDAIERVVAQMKLPENVRINLRGMVQGMRASFRSFALGLSLSVVLLYLILVAQFRSFKDPFLIM